MSNAVTKLNSTASVYSEPSKSIHCNGSAAQLFTHTVIEIEKNRILLDNGDFALQGYSCLIEVAVGDYVMVSHSNLGNYIVAILERNDRSEQVIATAGVQQVSLRAQNIHMVAEDSINQFAGKNIHLASPYGAILTQAKNMMTHISETLVQTAQRWMNRSNHSQIESRELLTIRSRHGLVEAQKDLRINAEHINMG